MKKLVSVLLIIALALTSFGCDALFGNPQKQLPTPKGVTATDTGLISWQAVEGATGYKVIINGQAYTSSTTSYQVSNTENDFTYSIVATAEGYTDSLPTQTYTFEGKGIIPPDPPVYNITVGITAPDQVKSGETVIATKKEIRVNPGEMCSLKLPTNKMTDGDITVEVVKED